MLGQHPGISRGRETSCPTLAGAGLIHGVSSPSPHHAGALRIEGPARYQVLHGDGVVALTKAVLDVQRVCLGQSLAVELDSQA